MSTSILRRNSDQSDAGKSSSCSRWPSLKAAMRVSISVARNGHQEYLTSPPARRESVSSRR